MMTIVVDVNQDIHHLMLIQNVKKKFNVHLVPKWKYLMLLEKNQLDSTMMEKDQDMILLGELLIICMVEHNLLSVMKYQMVKKHPLMYLLKEINMFQVLEVN